MMRVVSGQKKCQSQEQVSWNQRGQYEVNEEKPGVGFGDEVKHTEKSDLLPVEMMLVDEAV